MLDFGSFRDFAAAVRIFNSTALTKHSISLRLRILALRKIVEKEIDRSNATVPGDDKIGSRVRWWFAGSGQIPIEPFRHHLIPRSAREAAIENLDGPLLSRQQYDQYQLGHE